MDEWMSIESSVRNMYANLIIGLRDIGLNNYYFDCQKRIEGYLQSEKTNQLSPKNIPSYMTYVEESVFSVNKISFIDLQSSSPYTYVEISLVVDNGVNKVVKNIVTKLPDLVPEFINLDKFDLLCHLILEDAQNHVISKMSVLSDSGFGEF